MASRDLAIPAFGVKGLSGRPLHSTISKDNTNPSARNAMLLRGFGSRNKQVSLTTPGPEPPRKLFVGNLALGVDDERLKSEFEDAGDVSGARVVVDSNGNSKGFGYVEFFDSVSAAAALKMKAGTFLDGREIYVDLAAPSPVPEPRSQYSP